MLTTKDLLDPRHTPGPMEVKRTIGAWGIYAPEPSLIASVSTEADAALFAASPEMAKAVREYLEGLEDKWLPDHGPLLDAAPLYDLLARVYGTKEVDHV